MVWRHPELTFFACQETPKTKDLGHKDSDGDKELGCPTLGHSLQPLGPAPLSTWGRHWKTDLERGWK